MVVAGQYFSMVAILLAVTSSHVLSAPPPQEQQQKQEQQQDRAKLLNGKSSEKTADLTLLINETLRINNKLAPNSAATNQSFRDDWTFDRVEYDLMDFLQELNARYRHKNNTSSELSVQHQNLGPSSSLESKKDDSAHDENTNDCDTTAIRETVASNTQLSPAVSSVDSSDARLSLNKSSTTEPKIETNKTSGATTDKSEPLLQKANVATSTSPSELPISLASGDHDISESTWQYGIFDRFTRPKPSTTTPQPSDLLPLPGSGAALDVRTFNTDECGLRSYRVDPDYFPQAAHMDTEEVTKELSQRRQRPSLGSSFFQSHKKYHHTATGDSMFDRDLIRDELEHRDKLLPPPFDRYGESSSSSSSSSSSLSSGEPYDRRNYSSITSNDPYEKHESIFGLGDSSATSADGEFNLSSRRQWLQQQLGSTLQMLGFNSTNPAALDYLLNQTSGAPNSAMSLRENMMKMSGNKLGKSLDSLSSAADVDQSKLSGKEITDQELKARQDELKLEARVIGGNDARLGDSPWSASLQALVSRPGTGGVEYRHYCGGTIISEYYILTAAHCLDFMVGRESRLFVVIGDLNWRMSAASMHGRRFGIEKLIIHGGYKSTAFGHDIGLIRTKESMKPLKVNGRYIINSVCLPERNVEHSGEAELVGWGLFSNRNEMADSLQIADVPILPRPLCVDLYKRRTGLIQWLIGIELITEKQICAGTFGRGICQGDSGSALVFNEKVQLEGKAHPARLKSQLVRDAQQRATIIGIVAFGGIRRCSYQSLPGVYMQTSKYLDWILPRIQH